MKYLRLQLLAVLAFMATLALAQSNVLRVDTVRYPAGKVVPLQVLLENQSDIAGVQFDIALPYAIDLDSAVTLSRTRAANHELSKRDMGSTWVNSSYHAGISYYRKYRFIIYSNENALILDNGGALLTLNIPVSGELPNGSLLPVELADNSVVLTDRDKNNVLTSYENGSITIEEIPRPDLMPTDVDFDNAEVSPGTPFSVSWKVQNIGQVATQDGWSEQIALVSKRYNITRTLATVYYDGLLEAKGEVTRTATVDVPPLIGLDGSAKVQVTVVPTENTGEHPSLRDNNTAESSRNVTIGKELTLTLNGEKAITVTEGSGQYIQCKLNRSGRWDNVRQFEITSTDSRLNVPASVTVPAGQSGIVFYITVGDDDITQADYETPATIEVSGDGYDPATAQVIIIDNEEPALLVTASKTELTEGESFDLTITRPRYKEGDGGVTVTINSEDNRRFQFTSQVAIPDGQPSATVTVKTVDDELPNLEQPNLFTVSAQRYGKGEALVLLKDNDMPLLTLTLTPATVSESAGPTAVAAILTRTGKTDNKITLRISDDANGGLYYGNRSIEMAKGVETVYFNLGPVDNTIQEGDRTYTLTAGVWVASCSCASAGEQAGNVSATLTVLDNDGAALTIASQASTVKEGDTTKLTISRNTTDTTRALAVSLSSDYDEGLDYPRSVTIPAGEQSVDVEITSRKNDVSGDSRTVIFTVATDGYASGTCYILITDQTLPDARIDSIAIIGANASERLNSGVVGSTFTLTIRVVNEGAAPLPAATPITVYKKGEAKAIGTIYAKNPLAVGESETLLRTITLPDEVGVHTYYAVVNEAQSVAELVYTNNTSAEASVEATSPFTATVATDKAVYRQGETVVISGQLRGEQTAMAKAQVYIINDGARQTEDIVTNAQGQFTLEWTPYALQSGHFVVGVCFPGDPTTDEMASFDVYGLRRADNSYITCDITIGEPYTGVIRLQNSGSLPLSGVKAEVVGAPEGCEAAFSLPTDIAGGQAIDMGFTLNGTVPTQGNQWEMLKVAISSAEGAMLEVSIHYYARLATGNLVVESHTLNTTMVKDKGRDISLSLTNTGKGNTGRINLSLPEWITPLTGATMPGLDKNDTTTIVLRLMPTADMQLNVPITGMMGFNCENGNGTYINYSITPVSDSKGTLIVDVTDEYTYYTEEAPHVANAEVVLKNPVTGALVAQGRSGDDGLFTIELPEGYYQLNVTADKHDSYCDNILINPESTTRQTINLSYQAISVSWDVVETEVEDEYNVVTTVKYETNVPKPVVEMIVPDKIEASALGEGESLVFYAILTNKGLITAENTAFSIPEEAGGYRWEPLVECRGMLLAPQQSVTIPVKVTKMAASDSRLRKASGTDSDGCTTEPLVVWEYLCGADGKYDWYKRTIQYRDCPSTGGGGWYTVYGGGGGPGSPNGGGGSSYTSTENVTHVSGSVNCHPCLVDVSRAVIECGLGYTPAGCVVALGSGAYNAATGANTWMDMIGAAIGGVGCLIKNQTAGKITNTIGCAWSFITIIKNGCGAPSKVRRDYAGSLDEPQEQPQAPMPEWVKDYFNKVSPMEKSLSAYVSFMDELFGDHDFVEASTNEEIYDLLSAVQVAAPKGQLTTDALRLYKPQDVTDIQFGRFIERLNKTAAFEVTGIKDENMMRVDSLDKHINIILDQEKVARDQGYTSLANLFETETNAFEQRLERESSGVCATVSLQISQTMTMTRQAFRGTLTVANGNQDTPMRDIKLKLSVTNLLTAQVATAREFEIHTESLNTFDGELDMESGWQLAADATGTATILFIPSKFAAPETPVDYAFGGTLSYIDPYTGLEVVRDLYPVTLTVKPSPELDLTYFMQRDIYGDDPLTEEVEPMVPAEFAVIINNKGNGDATNVRMVTKQPEIIDNQKGLLIGFEFLSSQLNGQENTMALGESIPTDFGTIESHTQAYAQWWLQSTLLGHFVDYSIEATHVTSYGNENLSLLDRVTIHELIHGFTPHTSHLSPLTSKRAFLVNDIDDIDDMPDQVYFTDATQLDLNVTTNAMATKQSDTEYTLTVTPVMEGWTYGSVLDPTIGRQKLVKVVRQSDNAELPLDNVWQTDRTLIDGKEWLYENRLHFVGLMPAEGDTFLLTFEERPLKELQVEAFEGVPAEGTVQTEQLTSLTVRFNKSINAETFTTDDISLACQGTQLDASKITIEAVDETTFTLSLGELTLQNGYYVLTVQTAGITDSEGFRGATGRQATWVQFVGGKATIAVKATPTDGGTVTPATGLYDYGSTVTFTATPSEGYEFVRWVEGDNVIGENASIEYLVKGDATLTAVFQPKNIFVTVTYNERAGRVENGGTGQYAYGTTLSLLAIPNNGYDFEGWTVDGEGKGNNTTLTITLTGNVVIEALFSERPEITLTGRVTSSVDDTPIVNAAITLCNEGTVYTATTDRFGRYTLQVDDRSLIYQASCKADGYMWSATSDIWFSENSVAKDFVLIPGATLMMPDDGLCTFSATVPLDFSTVENVKAYYMSRYEQQSFVLQPAGKGVAGEGLILAGTPNERIDIPMAATAKAIDGNMLTGTAWQPYTVGEDYTYVMSATAEGAMFVLAKKGVVVPQGKAYVLFTTPTGQSIVPIIIDEESLVNAILADENGEPLHFNLGGRLTHKSTKGIHVKRGKKLVVK